MNKIKVADVTIREACSTSGINLSFKEKMEVAKQLDQLMIDVIEMPKAKEQADSLLIKSLAPVIKTASSPLKPASTAAKWKVHLRHLRMRQRRESASAFRLLPYRWSTFAE